MQAAARAASVALLACAPCASSGCGNTSAAPSGGVDAAGDGDSQVQQTDATTGDATATSDALVTGDATATRDAPAPESGAAEDAPADSAGEEAEVAPPPPAPVIPLANGTLRIEVWGPRTIRVLYGTTAPMPAASLAVNETRPITPFTVTNAGTTLTVATSALQAQVDKTSGTVTFLTPSGTVILSEGSMNPHQLMPASSGPGPYTSIGTFAPNAGERYYGLGEHQQQQSGNMTYSGSVQLLQKNPGESSIPLLFSTGGYGVLWDNPSVLDVNLSGGMVMQSEVADLIDYYFLYGPSADAVVASYRALTGAAPMFGRWALGYWQSHDHYATQSELLGTAATYRSKQIPIDNIVQDWQYWGSNPWGSHMFDSANYPDPKAMFTTLHQTGFHAMLSVWARFAQGSANYAALQSAGDFITPALSDGTTYYYDPFGIGGRSLYWSQVNTELFSLGVDAWWLDASEPELNANWGEFRNFKTSLGPGAVVYNAYPLMHASSIYEGQRAATSGQRAFILTRSAYAGSQRNGAATWSGDINGDWSTFARQIPGGLNFTLSGVPYWTTDVGGYFQNPPSPGFGTSGYTELFERWFQFAVFCPVFRVHGTGPDKDIYAFGAAAQTVLQGADNLRYRLLPYLYSLSWMVTSEAYTMMRALVFDFASDPKAIDIPDQYMFGPAFLVNPVTTQGATSRSVYLPGTGTWYDFWAGSTQSGGQSVMADAPIDHLPLYVPAGSIVPMGPIMQYSTAMPCDPIEIRVYKGADGAFTLYEDENDNYDYEKGMNATIPLTWNDATKTLTIGARQGSFPGMLQSRTFNVVFVAQGHGTGVDATATADKAVTYTGAVVNVTAP
jgi:alpha-D-xyloside xylohydrolase